MFRFISLKNQTGGGRSGLRAGVDDVRVYVRCACVCV